MEKIISQEKQNTYTENLIINNRKDLTMEGVCDIVSTSDTLICLKLKDTNVNIFGENINIKKIDVNTGILQAEGKFNCIKYGKSGNIFKRIFK